MERARFGLETLDIDRRVINILPQIRSVFDEEKLQELARAIPEVDIDESGVVRFGLINPPTVALLTTKAARAYLREFNQFRKENKYPDTKRWRLDDLMPCDTTEGIRYAILIAGERRVRAGTAKVQEKYGGDIPALWSCSVHRDISFMEALPIQFKENNARANPSAADEARAIISYYRSMGRHDKKITKKECARQFGISVGRFRDAEIFVGYPVSMQALADQFPFPLVVRAKGLYEAWKKYHEQQESDARTSSKGGYTFTAGDGRTFFTSAEDVAAYETETMLRALTVDKIGQHTSVGYQPVTLDMLEEAVARKTAQGDGLVSDGTVLEIVSGIEVTSTEASNPSMRRLAINQQLARSAQRAIEFLDGSGMDAIIDAVAAKLTPESRDELIRRLQAEAKAEAEAGARSIQDDEGLF